MAYATQADLVPLRITLGDLAELTSDDETPDATVVQGALDDASSLVDSYCGKRFATPLQSSRFLTKLTCDIAIYNLASNRRDTKPTETWTENYQQALKFLRDVSNGDATIPSPAVGAQPQGSSADVTTSCKPQVFSDDNLRSF